MAMIGDQRIPKRQDYVFDFLNVGHMCQVWMSGLNVGTVVAKNVGVFKLDKVWMPEGNEPPIPRSETPDIKIRFSSGPLAGATRIFKLTMLYSYSSFYVHFNGLEVAKLIASGMTDKQLAKLMDQRKMEK